MDYPHPLVTVNRDGRIDLSDAYDVGIGAWDAVAIRYGYQDFPAGADAPSALGGVLDAAWDEDLRFMTGQDTGANPRVHIWANGADPAAELLRMLGVRRAALERFGETAVRNGTPLALLEETLVPLFLHHRYQIEAAASALGGVDYTYAFRGDGREPLRAVPAADQRAALEALMRVLHVDELTVPADVIDLIPPRPAGYGRHRELFPRYTGSTFDPITPAVVAADLTVSALLRPERAARLVEQHALDSDVPGLVEVIDALVQATFGRASSDGYRLELQRAVQRVVVDRLIRLASVAPMAQVRALAAYRLEVLPGRLVVSDLPGEVDRIAHLAHVNALERDVTRFLEAPGDGAEAWEPPSAPPGSPIGDPGLQWLPEPFCSQWSEPTRW